MQLKPCWFVPRGAMIERAHRERERESERERERQTERERLLGAILDSEGSRAGAGHEPEAAGTGLSLRLIPK
jgi:hypothetical protein